MEFAKLMQGLNFDKTVDAGAVVQYKRPRELKNLLPFIATFLITVKRLEIFYLPTKVPVGPRAHRPVPSFYEL